MKKSRRNQKDTKKITEPNFTLFELFTRPQLGPFFVLKFVCSRGEISLTVSKVLSDTKVLFKHKNGR